ncbi:MAG TPA: GNAT family N-acetyltransferase [Steroidobacteraceae bacterium]|nr:GNAT family N-acetyltransferase [Steroidobacteraceae bacterium]
MRATTDMLTIRTAGPADADSVAMLVRELADYERMSSAARATAADFRRELELPAPVVRVLLAEQGGELAAFALYFFNFSTFVGRRGLYLEDLFVRPAFRRQGVGLALFAALAREAEAHQCGRMEWAVLDWNEPAIRFYQSLGAEPLDEWRVFRLTPPAIAALSARARRTPS